MKRFLCIALTLTMVLGALAGCGNTNNDPQPNTPPDSSAIVDDVNTPEDTSTPDESSEPEVIPPSDEAPEIVATSVNDRVRIIIDRVRDIESKEAFPVEINNDNGVLDLLGLTEEDVAEYAITYSPMNVHAYMIAVIKPAEAKDDVVTAALKEYHQATIKSFEQYLPDQLEIASNAAIFADAGYLGIVMCENSAEVEKNLITGLEGIEEIKIDESKATSADNTDTTEPTESTEPTDEESSKENSDVNSNEASTSNTETQDNNENTTENEGLADKATKSVDKIKDAGKNIVDGANTQSQGDNQTQDEIKETK